MDCPAEVLQEMDLRTAPNLSIQNKKQGISEGEPLTTILKVNLKLGLSRSNRPPSKPCSNNTLSNAGVISSRKKDL
jgi:hypothetical protein